MRLSLTILAIGLLSAGVAACGGSDSTSSTSSPPAPTIGTSDAGANAATTSSGPVDEMVDVSAPASGDLVFDQKSLKASAGNDEFDFNNPSSVSHNFCIRSSSGDELGCSEDVTNGTTTLAAQLDPGKYVFYCGEPDHQEAGMQGTLTVS